MTKLKYCNISSHDTVSMFCRVVWFYIINMQLFMVHFVLLWAANVPALCSLWFFPSLIQFFSVSSSVICFLFGPHAVINRHLMFTSLHFRTTELASCCVCVVIILGSNIGAKTFKDEDRWSEATQRVETRDISPKIRDQHVQTGHGGNRPTSGEMAVVSVAQH